MTVDLEESSAGDDLLADNTMDGLDAPPELPQGQEAAPGALPQVAQTPQHNMPQPAVMPYSQPRSVFPGDKSAPMLPSLLRAVLCIC